MESIPKSSVSSPEKQTPVAGGEQTEGITVNNPYSDAQDPTTGQFIDVIKTGACESQKIEDNTLPAASVSSPEANE